MALRTISWQLACGYLAVCACLASAWAAETNSEAPSTGAKGSLALCYEIELNTSSDSTAAPAMPRLAPLPDSSFIVAWKAQAAEDRPAGIYIQRMGVNGNKRGMEILASSDDPSGHTGAPGNPDIAVHTATGRFALVWISVDPDGHMPPELFFRPFEYNGFPLSLPIKVSDNVDFWNIFSPSVVSSNNTYLVSWIEKRSVAVRGKGRLQYSLFGLSGESQSVDRVLVFNDTGMAHDILPLPNNQFVITWQSWVSDRSESEHLSIYAQLRHIGGAVLADSRKVSTHLTGVQQNPSLVRTGANRWLTIWAMHDTTNAYEGIFSQTLNNTADRQNTGGRDVEIDDVNAHGLFAGNCLDFPHTADLSNGAFAVTWTVYDGNYDYPYCRGQRRGVCVQAFRADNTRIPMTQPCFDVGTFSASQPLNTPRARITALPNGDMVLAYYADARGVVLRKFSSSSTGCQVAKAPVDATGAWVLIVVLFLLCGSAFAGALWYHKQKGSHLRSKSTMSLPDLQRAPAASV